MLSGFISSLDISFWPQVALLVFLGVFMTAAVRIYRMSPNESDAAARLPLDD